MNTQADSKLVYVVEDSVASGTLYCSYLEAAGFRATLYKDGKSAMVAISQEMPDVIVQDVFLPDVSGMDVLNYAKRKNPDVPVIVITANSSIDAAVDAMRQGGFDFIEKPFNKDRLLMSAQAAVRVDQSGRAASVEKSAGANANVSTGTTDIRDIFVGESLPMQYVYKMLKSAASTKASVFVTGESGTGKELCALALHRLGARASGPFIALNCAAIPAELFESEIFGHVKGAFSGAMTDRKGAAELADGGTLFLDELCEMDLALQAKLLRFIQTGKFTPVGGSEERLADIRFVCATNRDPEQEVIKGNFREDLFYRLNVVPVHLPPLRDRGTDILSLAQRILEQKSRDNGRAFTAFGPDVKARLLSYDWPGNIRELQNMIEKAVVINEGDVLTLPMLGLDTRSSNAVTPMPGPAPMSRHEAPTNNALQGPQILPLWQVEKNAIEEAIAACDGNIPLAAACLRVSASTIYRKKKAWEEGAMAAEQ